MVRKELFCDRLPEAWDGARILFFSDIHYTGRRKRLESEAARLINAEPHDVIIFGGDAVGVNAAWEKACAWFRGLQGAGPRLAVPGNWDYRYAESAAWLNEFMAASGFEMLRNQSRMLEKDGQALAICGLDDVRFGQPDAAKAEPSREDVFRLFVSHSPDVLLGLEPARFDLLLCGHTHGGQVRLPRYGALITSTKIGKRYEAGLYEPARGHYVYVSRGIGSARFNLRINCPSEMVVLTLRRRASREIDEI